MALIGTEIINEAQRANNYRAHVDFIFTGGRRIRRIINVLNQADLAAAITANEAGATKTIQKKDAAKLISKVEAIAAEGEASANDVARNYLQEALREPDLMTAFKMYKNIRTYVIAQGWTNAQIKAGSGLNDKEWAKLKARLDFFADNLATINAFIAISDADPGAY